MDGKGKAKLSSMRVKMPLKRENDKYSYKNDKKDETTRSFDDVDENQLQIILEYLKHKKTHIYVKQPYKREPGRKYTEDGLPIYSAEELQIGKPNSGKTPLCPFDCDCCF